MSQNVKYIEAEKWIESFDWGEVENADEYLAIICEALQECVKNQELKDQGKLFDLPCKPFDRVYTIYQCDIEECFKMGMEPEDIIKEVCEKRIVAGFEIRHDGVWIVLLGGMFFNSNDKIPIEEFGKTVFMNKSETLKAVKGIKNE